MSDLSRLKNRLQQIAFDDLEDWAGETILQRGQRYINRVYELSITTDDWLVARVSGSEDYTTAVAINVGVHLDWNCNCPYDWGPCKHAVAVVLAAAQLFKQGSNMTRLDNDIHHFIAQSDLPDTELDEDPLSDSCAAAEKRQSSGQMDLGQVIKKLKKAQLADLLQSYAENDPSLATEIFHRAAAQDVDAGPGDFTQAKREIRKQAAIQAWYDPWKHCGRLPDYTKLEKLLQKMALQGRGDELLQLGEILWKKGLAQIESSDDEGHSAEGISACMMIILDALPTTSMKLAERLCWLIDKNLEDNYGLLNIDDMLTQVDGRRDDWLAVVSMLEKRLDALPPANKDDFYSQYSRKAIVDRLVNAYKKSDCVEKILPLLQREADGCQNYLQVAMYLTSQGELQEARQWCIHGYQQTIEKAPGLASDLQDHLQLLAKKEQRHDLVAAYQTESFFERPSVERYLRLQNTATKLGVWPAVRDGVIAFLESGSRPWQSTERNSETTWPLPKPEVTLENLDYRHRYISFPDHDMLIRVAVVEQRLKDAIDQYRTAKSQGHFLSGTDEFLAEHVIDSHPDVVLDIWRDLAEKQIRMVNVKAYKNAAVYLKRFRNYCLDHNRGEDWSNLLAELRTKHKAKRRLMEILKELQSGRRMLL